MKSYYSTFQRYFRYGIILIPRMLRLLITKSTRLFPSDEFYIKLVYFLTFGKWLDFSHPEKLTLFNEKLQWLKIHDVRPVYTRMVDKLAVKDFIREKIGEGHTFPLLGCWRHFNEIDFEQLPEAFVLKPTHDSGSIVFCRDKKTFDKKSAERKLEKALNRNFYWYGRETPYKDVPPRLIAEPMMVDESGTQLKDYKLFCFNGKVRMIQVHFDRFVNHSRNLYTPDWKLLDAFIRYPNDSHTDIPRPACLDKMLELAERLSVGIPFVRVDLYVINGQIYFGEFTFFHGNGLLRVKPHQFHEQMGRWLELPIAQEEK